MEPSTRNIYGKETIRETLILPLKLWLPAQGSHVTRSFRYMVFLPLDSGTFHDYSGLHSSPVATGREPWASPPDDSLWQPALLWHYGSTHWAASAFPQTSCHLPRSSARLWGFSVIPTSQNRGDCHPMNLRLMDAKGRFHLGQILVQILVNVQSAPQTFALFSGFRGYAAGSVSPSPWQTTGRWFPGSGVHQSPSGWTPCWCLLVTGL